MDLNSDIDMLDCVALESQQYEEGFLKTQQDLENRDDDLFDNICSEEIDNAKTPGEIMDEFCSKLNDVNNTLPDSVIAHYMKKTGFIINDAKLVKIISIASQKFISEIINDCMQHNKLKYKTTSSVAPSSSATQPSTSFSAQGLQNSSLNVPANVGSSTQQTVNTLASAPKVKTAVNTGSTLTLEDLSQILTEYGINVKKPYYFM